MNIVKINYIRNEKKVREMISKINQFMVYFHFYVHKHFLVHELQFTPLCIHRLCIHRWCIHKLCINRLCVHRLCIHRLLIHNLMYTNCVYTDCVHIDCVYTDSVYTNWYTQIDAHRLIYKDWQSKQEIKGLLNKKSK